jgi:hypothetical protein
MTGRRRAGRPGRSLARYLVLAAVLACLAALCTTTVLHGRPAAATAGLPAAGAPASAVRTAAPPAAATDARATTASARPSARPTAGHGTPGRTAAAGTAAQPVAPRPGPGQRTLTMVNRLGQTIWPAVAADPAHPVAATGWVLPPGASLTIVIPDHWDVRVWARTGCVFDAAGNGHCVTGDCDGHFQCGRTWGQFPSTLAEFNLNAWDGMDFYDVSLVEGNNLPMWVNNSGGRSPDPISADGCSAAGCTHDANVGCPSALQETHDGAVVACRSACLAIGGDQTCCLGAWASRAACNPADWPVDSAAVFKKAEPFAYSYVDDDATSVLTCTGECDYRITWGVS